MFQSAHEDPTAEPWPWDNTALEGCDGKEHHAVMLLQDRISTVRCHDCESLFLALVSLPHRT